jgi:integrase
MASVWIVTRVTPAGAKRYRVEYRLGGRESRTTYGGSFKTQREALERRRWIAGELAAVRVPDLRALTATPERAPALAAVAKRWQASRVDVRDSTAVQHRTALGRVLPELGAGRVDELTPADVATFVGKLAAAGYARESIRKSVTALAMVLDFAGVVPNPARDRVHVRLPREEPEEPEPPIAEHVEVVARLLAPSYRLALLVLDATGCRVGELEAARVGDVDAHRQAWLVRAAVAKTRRARWVELPDDLWEALMARQPPPDDRDPDARLFGDVTAGRLRMAIGRACRAAGVPRFSPHALRDRRVSLLHKRGHTWAEIGDRVGQRSRIVTADKYTFVLGDYREVDRSALLERVR